MRIRARCSSRSRSWSAATPTPAYRRTVARAHGWYGFALTPEVAADYLAALRAVADDVERPAELGELEITVTPRGRLTREIAAAFADLGVDRLVVMPHPAADDVLPIIDRRGRGRRRPVTPGRPVDGLSGVQRRGRLAATSNGSSTQPQSMPTLGRSAVIVLRGSSGSGAQPSSRPCRRGGAIGRGFGLWIDGAVEVIGDDGEADRHQPHAPSDPSVPRRATRASRHASETHGSTISTQSRHHSMTSPDRDGPSRREDLHRWPTHFPRARSGRGRRRPSPAGHAIVDDLADEATMDQLAAEVASSSSRRPTPGATSTTGGSRAHRGAHRGLSVRPPTRDALRPAWASPDLMRRRSTIQLPHPTDHDLARRDRQQKLHRDQMAFDFYPFAARLPRAMQHDVGADRLHRGERGDHIVPGVLDDGRRGRAGGRRGAGDDASRSCPCDEG